MADSADLLLDALRTRDYREAEALFVRWARAAEAEGVLALVPQLDDAEVRRLGHAIHMALAAGLLDNGRFAPVVRALADRAGLDQLFGDVRRIWQPDVAFEAGRLRRRAEELARSGR